MAECACVRVCLHLHLLDCEHVYLRPRNPALACMRARASFFFCFFLLCLFLFFFSARIVTCLRGRPCVAARLCKGPLKKKKKKGKKKRNLIGRTTVADET